MNGTGDDRGDRPRPRRVKRALSFSTPNSESQRPVGTSPTARPPHYPDHNQHQQHNDTHEAAQLTRDNKKICHLMGNTTNYNYLSTCLAEKPDHYTYIQANRVMKLVR